MDTRPLITEVREQIRRLQTVVTALEGLNDGRRTKKSSFQENRPKRTMSVAARKRIAAAQRARWAKWRKAA